MEPRKLLMALCLVLAVALSVLFYKSVTQDVPGSRDVEPAEAARRAALQAGKGLRSSGPMGSMLESMSQARSGIVPADGLPAESLEFGRVGTSAPGAATVNPFTFDEARSSAKLSRARRPLVDTQASAVSL